MTTQTTNRVRVFDQLREIREVVRKHGTPLEWSVVSSCINDIEEELLKEKANG